MLKRSTLITTAVTATLVLTLGASLAIAMPLLDAAGSAETARQVRRVPPQQRINTFVRDNRLPSFVKDGKLHFATKTGMSYQKYMEQLSPNMVEFFLSPGFHHLYTRVGDKTYSRISGLSESGFYASGSERIGVLVRLTDAEMGRLKTYVDSALRSPHQVIGPFEYNGGRPPDRSNCTSWITWAKIGDRGETLARLLGVYESGFPQGFIGSLMRSPSDRVEAVVVHSPRGGTFNNSYQYDLR